MKNELVSLETIQSAYPAVKSIVHRTPMMSCTNLTEKCGFQPGQLLLKMENLQRTGSFKIRGAYHRISSLSETEKAAGVVAASAGNHAQGVALASKLIDIRSMVFMPEFASIAKIQATRKYGAEVVLEGKNFDEAVSAAKEFAAKNGCVFISAYDDDGIITGQGTLGLEIFEDASDIETILICVGGGGLFSGVASVIRRLAPKAKIIGIQAAGAPSAVESWKAGRLVPRGETNTIADGVAIKSPSERTFRYIQEFADEMAVVEDSDIAKAMLMMLERAKMVVEPAGAVGVAALLSGKVKVTGKTVVTVSGGNVDVKFLADLIEREMINAKRYMHFFSSVPDKPGGLAALLDRIAEFKGNIITVNHNRISPSVPLGQTGVELLLEVRDQDHITRINEGLRSLAYRVEMLD